MKKCGRCKIEKNDDEFSTGQLKTSGGICRKCNTEVARIYRSKNQDKVKKYQKEYDKNYYQTNKDKILEDKKIYYQENREEKLDQQHEYYQNNREKILNYNKLYYEENKDKLVQYAIEYQINNSDKVRENHRIWYKNKRINDINYRIKTNISANINFYLKSHGFSKNNNPTLKYLSYSIDELKQYLEKNFEPWMNWNNYGRYDVQFWNDNDQSTWTWQIDHIIPHSTFKYTSMEDEEFKKCWSLDNLRPLSSKQNFLEGVKRIRH